MLNKIGSFYGKWHILEIFQDFCILSFWWFCFNLDCEIVDLMHFFVVFNCFFYVLKIYFRVFSIEFFPSMTNKPERTEQLRWTFVNHVNLVFSSLLWGVQRGPFILSADARPTTTLESINLYEEFLSKRPLQHQSSLSSGRDASNVVRRANWQSG